MKRFKSARINNNNSPLWCLESQESRMKQIWYTFVHVTKCTWKRKGMILIRWFFLSFVLVLCREIGIGENRAIKIIYVDSEFLCIRKKKFPLLRKQSEMQTQKVKEMKKKSIQTKWNWKKKTREWFTLHPFRRCCSYHSENLTKSTKSIEVDGCARIGSHFSLTEHSIFNVCCIYIHTVYTQWQIWTE